MPDERRDLTLDERIILLEGRVTALEARSPGRYELGYEPPLFEPGDPDDEETQS